MPVVGSIELDDPKYVQCNLGGVLVKNTDLMKRLNVVRVSLRIQNEHMYGSYNIPESVGFAIPIHLLHGATLVMSDDVNDSKVSMFELLNKFISVHQCNAMIKVIRPKTYNSTQTTCSICMSDYVEDSQIIDLHCNHRFHYKCLTDYVVHECTIPRCSSMKTHQNHSAFGVVSSTSAQCPNCKAEITF
jgi:hypothetical protein